MLLNNKRLQRKYDPEYSYAEANRLSKAYTHAEVRQWFQSPCTQELLHRLEGDIAAIMLAFMSGGYANADSIDETAQATAKAMGLAQAIDSVMDAIDEMLESKDDEDKDQGTEGSDTT